MQHRRRATIMTGLFAACSLAIGLDDRAMAKGMVSSSAQGGTSSTDAAPPASSGRVSAPPANSAMRRAGGSSAGATAAGSAMDQARQSATPTNAMTLTSNTNGRTGIANGAGSQQQGNAGRNAPQQPAPSIDSNGMIRRGNATTPR